MVLLNCIDPVLFTYPQESTFLQIQANNHLQAYVHIFRLYRNHSHFVLNGSMIVLLVVCLTVC